jgi:hypothetical protein
MFREYGQIYNSKDDNSDYCGQNVESIPMIISPLILSNRSASTCILFTPSLKQIHNWQISAGVAGITLWVPHIKGNVKGTVSWDFRPLFFFIKQYPLEPYLNSASHSPRYDRFSDAKIVHENYLLGSPFKFKYHCSGGVGQFAYIHVVHRYYF